MGVSIASRFPLDTSYAQDMFVWHLMHFMAPSPAARLGMADAEGVQMLTDMLEGRLASWKVG
eukprot:1159705-Pelagomonas_calceolata.AAC.10